MKTLTALIVVLAAFTVVTVEFVRSGHWVVGFLFALIAFGAINYKAED